MFYFGLDISKLRTGDVILVRGHGLVGWLVRKITKSKFAHAELYAGQGMIIESTNPFAYSKNVQREVFRSREHVIVRRSVEDPIDLELDAVVANARGLVGSRYSKLDAIATVFKKSGAILKKIRDVAFYCFGGDMFCSRLVAEAYEEAGIQIVANPSQCKPSDLAETDLLFTVNDCLHELSDEEQKIIRRKNMVGFQKLQFRFWFSIVRLVASVCGYKIRTVNDVESFLIQHRKLDSFVVGLIKITNYHKTYRRDLKINPERYSAKALMDRVRDNIALIQFIRFEYSITHKNLLMRFQDLIAAVENYESFHLRYQKLNVDILSGYIFQIGLSFKAFRDVLKLKGINDCVVQMLEKDIDLIDTSSVIITT